MQQKNIALAISIALTTTMTYGQDSETLDTVTVEDVYVAPTPIEDFQEMSESTATDLKDVLADHPEVSFGSGNGGSQWLTVRGLGQENVDVVVDGTTTSSSLFHHQSRFNLDPALVKVIDIEKGTGSASSGLGATGGRIKARTVDAADLLEDGKNVGARINVGISSNDGYSVGLSAYGRSGGFDGIVVINRVDNDDYKDGNGDTVENSALKNQNILAKAAYNLNDNNRIELSHRHETSKGVRNLREEFIYDAGNGDERLREIVTDTTNLTYEGSNLGSLGEVEANIFYINTDQDETLLPTSNIRELDAASTTYGANIGFTTPVGTDHKVKYGINWRHEEVEPAELTSLQTQEKTDLGVYVEGIWNLEPVTLTTGLRYDYFDYTNTGGDKVSDGALSPSIGVIWDVTDTFSLNASYNIATRSPRLREAALSNTTVLFGDNIKAERSKNAEIGFDWDYNGLSVSGSYFYQTIDHLSVYERACRACDTYMLSQGKLKNHGYELNAAYRLNGLTARAGVAYSKPSVDGVNFDHTKGFVLGRTWTTGLSYQFENPNLEIGWRGRYAQSTSYLNNNGAEMHRAGYGVHDLYLNWKPTGKDDFNVNFSVNNVGDKVYASHAQRVSTRASVEAGREYRLNFNYSF